MPVISIRVSDEWLALVDGEAELRQWSRNAAVVNLVWQALSVREKLDTERARGRKLVGERKPDGAERHIEQSAGQQCHAEPEGTRVQVPPSVITHAATCRCYICKPPTP